MKKLLPAILIGLLVFVATLYLLRSGRQAPPPPMAEATAQPAPTGEIQQLNEVVLRAPPSPSVVPAATPASSMATMPMVADPPPPLEREYDVLLDNSAPLKAAHSVFEREPREEPWATLMERRWQQAFAANHELLAYGTPTVHCRTTRCEVRLVVYQTITLDQGVWRGLVVGKAGQRDPADQSAPLVSGIRSSLLASTDSNGARVTLLQYDYMRNPPAAQ